MSTYQYRCPEHGFFEVSAKIFNPPPTAICPVCKAVCSKVVSVPIVRFKGSGWTVKDKSHEFEQRFPTLAKQAAVGD